jgi:hypothetical protein
MMVAFRSDSGLDLLLVADPMNRLQEIQHESVGKRIYNVVIKQHTQSNPMISLFDCWISACPQESFILHARIFKYLDPLSTRTSMATLQMSPEMLEPEEIPCLIAFPEFMSSHQMFETKVPIRLRKIRKVFAAVSASVLRNGIRDIEGMERTLPVG